MLTLVGSHTSPRSVATCGNPRCGFRASCWVLAWTNKGSKQSLQRHMLPWKRWDLRTMLLSLWASDQAQALQRHVGAHSPARQLVNRPAHRLLHLLKQRQDIRYRKEYSSAASVNLVCGAMATFLSCSMLYHAVRKGHLIKGFLCNFIDNFVFAFWYYPAIIMAKILLGTKYL